MNKFKVLKKVSKIIAVLTGVVLLAFIFLTRFKGIAVRFTDGRFLGYSPQTNETGEWLLMEYPNVPVRQDGPYVLNEGGRKLAIYIEGDGVKNSKVVRKAIANNVVVKVDNEANTQFMVPLKDQYPRSQLSIPNQDSIIVISDLEGEFDAMVTLLRGNHVIDEELNWNYGKGHLVLIGDMVDRGENVVPLLWLLYKLEGEAQLAGGNLHYVLGNHERYLLDGRVKSTARKYFGTFRSAKLSQRELWSEHSELGRWLRSKPALVKIGKTLFVHGGISPSVLKANPSLESIDREVENNFVIGNVFLRNISDSPIHGSEGVLFYRGFAKDMSEHNLYGKASSKHVDDVLSFYDVRRIAIGHSLAKNIGYDYDGKVIRVDVHHSEGRSEALLIENNQLWKLDVEGNRSSLARVQNVKY